jgi:hypothetical protein
MEQKMNLSLVSRETYTDIHLIRITFRNLCFGMIVRDDIIVKSAPVARWCVGRTAYDVWNYWHHRGAKVEVFE